MNNKITIAVENGEIGFHSETPLHADEFFEVIFTTALSFMEHITSKAPAEDQPQVKEELYDLFNSAASRVLEMYAPEFELHPNLTTQAILEAENKIVLEGRLGEVQKGS